MGSSSPKQGKQIGIFQFSCLTAFLWSSLNLGYSLRKSMHTNQINFNPNQYRKLDVVSEVPKGLRYYIYPEEAISLKLRVLKKTLAAIHNKKGGAFSQIRYPLSELSVHEALAKHELRTYDPDEADFFIVPTPISAVYVSGCRHNVDRNCTDFDDAFDALSKHEIFIKDGYGKRHIIVGLMYTTFSNVIQNEPLTKSYPKLRNVILASRTDPLETWKIHRDGLSLGTDFCNKFLKEGPPVTRSSFCVGQGLEDHIPLVKPSMKKFQESEFFIFYRTRSSSFLCNSTVYRRAPLNYTNDLAPCSVGTSIGVDQWQHDIANSKFCLVVRGDDPSSHSFLHSVRSGCIPVVVSDFFESYGAPFKSILNISDFSVMIKEEEFLSLSSTPGKVLNDRLRYMSYSDIESKLKKLEEAQRVIFPDHQESIFVPSFLKEAQNALVLADELESDEKDKAARLNYDIVKGRQACILSKRTT